MKPVKREFNGVFAEQIVGFINKKQAMGYDYREGAYIMYSFEEFCIKYFPEVSVLNQEITLKWAEKREIEKSRCQLNRISVVREFARYMNSIGIPSYVIPPFATHRLYKWLQDGENINACLSYLSEYMEHAKLSSTMYYIHLVPEFYPKMIELGLESSVNIIPDMPL
jgi:hypothetical protein